VFAQRLIHAALPTGALAFEVFDHVLVEPEADSLLRTFRKWSATRAIYEIKRFF